MTFHNRLGFPLIWGPVYFEASEVASGGQGTQPTEAQPPAGGQGGSGEVPTAQQGDFNWGLFPDVPEEQRPLLQPHLRNVLGHVTRLETQYAPFKPFIQAGLTRPEEIQGLLGFTQSFDQDPVETWYNLGKSLQEGRVLTGDIDFAEVRNIIDGNIQSDSEDGLPEGVDPNEPLGMALARVQELEEKVNKIETVGEQERTQRQQQIEERLLHKAVTDMKAELREAGIPEDRVTDQMLHGLIITHRGDHQAAIGSLLGFRDGSVRATLQNHTTRRAEVNAPRGAPPAPRPNQSRDPWTRARMGAEQFLKQQISEET